MNNVLGEGTMHIKTFMFHVIFISIFVFRYGRGKAGQVFGPFPPMHVYALQVFRVDALRNGHTFQEESNNLTFAFSHQVHKEIAFLEMMLAVLFR